MKKMNTTPTSTAEFMVTFWKKMPNKNAFVETQKHITTAKTRIELEMIEEFIIYFFENSPEKKQILRNQIHHKITSKNHERRYCYICR